MLWIGLRLALHFAQLLKVTEGESNEDQNSLFSTDADPLVYTLTNARQG